MKHLCLFNFVTLLFAFSSPASAVLDIRDGEVHDIDYAVNEAVRVDYGAPGKQTTVNLLDGGVINDSTAIMMLTVYEDGRVNILGGTVRRGGVFAYDRSEVTVVAGYAGTELHSRNSSHVVFTGGSVGPRFYAFDSSVVDFYGGSAGRLFAMHHSTVTMSGGTIGHDLIASDSSQVDITGGVIGPQLWAEDIAQVSVSGGFIEQYIVANDTSTITVYGSEFNYGFGQIPVSSGRLTGVLASGESIDNIFYIKDGARIILVPEPATLTLLSFGGLGLLRRRKQVQIWLSAQSDHAARVLRPRGRG